MIAWVLEEALAAVKQINTSSQAEILEGIAAILARMPELEPECERVVWDYIVCKKWLREIYWAVRQGDLCDYVFVREELGQLVDRFDTTYDWEDAHWEPAPRVPNARAPKFVHVNE